MTHEQNKDDIEVLRKILSLLEDSWEEKFRSILEENCELRGRIKENEGEICVLKAQMAKMIGISPVESEK